MMRAPRMLALALVGAAAVLWLATSFVSPYPVSAFGVEERVRAEGAVDARRLLVAVHSGYPHSYDAANDTTLLYVEMCSHSLCTPLVPVRGDLRGAIVRGPWLLDPAEDTLRLVPAPARENGSLPYNIPDRGVTDAYSSVFELRSPAPPFAARALALALAGAGLAILAISSSWGAAAALGVLPSLLVARAPSFIILVQIAGVPFLLIAIIVAVVRAIQLRRATHATTVAIAALLVILSGVVAFMHFRPDGGD